MSVAFSSNKEILSFHELERRKLFRHNKRLLRSRLNAMEREIQHLTATHTIDYKPKGPVKTKHIASQKIILTEEESEKERNWPRTIDTKFQNELLELQKGKRALQRNKRRMKNSVSAPNIHPETTANRSNSNNNNSFVSTIHTTPIKTNLSQRKRRVKKLVPIGGGLGPRFPRAILAGVTNGPTPQDYTLPGLFGTSSGGELLPTFAWDETRDHDWFQEGAFWDLRMKALANERKASMLERQAAAKKTQSRRLKQQAKEELVNADQTDRRQKNKPRKWFLKQLEGGETLSFQYVKAGQLSATAKQSYVKL